jgi:hypothetical protein
MNDEDNFEFLSEKRKNEPILIERKSNKLHKIIGFLIVYFSIFLIYFPRKLNNKFYSFSVNTEVIKEDKGNEDNNLKLALCTMGKKENLYVREFVEYYIKIGFDHLFLYDDNDPNTEKIIDEVPAKLKDKVTVIDNLRSININNQSDAFTDCYHKNLYKYDWILMVDMDEFLFVIDDTLKHYLKNPVFDKCDFIKFHWGCTTDNGLVHYDNRTLMERFKSPFIKIRFIKTIVRGGIPDLLYWVHSPRYSPKRNVTCSNVGKVFSYTNINFESVTPINVEKAFIIHFKYKSTEEFVNKYTRGYRDWFHDYLEQALKNILNEYFEQNKITLEKINLVEKGLKKNLRSFKIDYYFTKIFYFWFDFLAYKD